MTHLRRGAERHRIERRTAFEHGLEAREMRDVLDPAGVGADRGDQREPAIGQQRRQVLVAGHFAQANDRNPDGGIGCGNWSMVAGGGDRDYTDNNIRADLAAAMT